MRRMIRGWGLRLVWLPMLFLAEGVAGASTVCLRDREVVRVRVRFEAARPRFDNDQSRERISAMMVRKTVGAHSVGLTKSALYWKVSARFMTASRGDREERCVHLTELTLDYGFGATPVFIDRRYPPGGCPYETILRHEKGHVAILDREGGGMRDWLQRRLSAIAADIPAMATRSPKKTEQELLTRIENQTTPLFKLLKDRLTAAHARLDSPENLRQTQKQCKKW
ncbi:MAG: hypothetical protein HQL76_05715 [Magnetococcales bacterium]|nr:hypothetical protein [Magnetococcales bacterium]